MILQQVRDLLTPFRPSVVPLELKDFSLVHASTPTVSAGSVLDSERDSCSASSALVLVCVRTVHYIWRINGAPQGTRRELLDVLQENRELSGFGGMCRSRIGRTSTYENVYGGLLLLGRKVRVLYVEMYASRLNILLTTGTELSRTEFFCTAQPPLDFPRNIGNCAGISCLTHRVFYCNLRWFRLRFQDDACPFIPLFDRGESVCWSRYFARHDYWHLPCDCECGDRTCENPAETLEEVPSRSSRDERTSAWGCASFCRSRDVGRGLGDPETGVGAWCLDDDCTRRRVSLIVFDPASHLLGAGGGVIALLLRKWLVDLIAHLTACPALVFTVLLKPLVFGDLDLVLIPALAHNMRVPSLDRYASVRATALSLAKIRLDIAYVQLRRDPAIEPLSSCLAVTHRARVGYCVSDGPRSIMSVGSGVVAHQYFRDGGHTPHAGTASTLAYLNYYILIMGLWRPNPNKNLHSSRRRSSRTLVYAAFYMAGGNWRARRTDFILE